MNTSLHNEYKSIVIVMNFFKKIILREHICANMLLHGLIVSFQLFQHHWILPQHILL